MAAPASAPSQTQNTFGQPVSQGGGTIVPQFQQSGQMMPTFINALPQSPVPPPKSVAVMTGKAAQDDLAMKKTATNELAAGVAQHSANQVGNAQALTAQPQIGMQAAPTGQQQPQQGQQPQTQQPQLTGTKDQILQQLQSNPGGKLTPQQAQSVSAMGLPGVTVNADGTYNVATVQQNANGTPGAPSTGNAVLDYVNQQKQQLQTQQDTAFQGYMQQVQQIQNGTFPMTAQQQSQVNALQQQFAQLKTTQTQANDTHLQAVQQLGIRSGRTQYQPGAQDADIQAAITQGQQKLSDLNSQANDAVAKLQQGFLTQDYNMINDQYANLTKYMDQKTSALNDMVTSVKDAVSLQTQQTQQQKNLIDLQTAQTNSIARAVTDTALKPDGSIDLQKIQDAADNYGIDPATLYGAVQAQSQALKLQNEAEQKFQAELTQTKLQSAKTAQEINTANQAQSGANVVAGLPSDKVQALTDNGFTRFNGNTQSLAQSLVTGQLAPSQLSKRTTGSSSYNDVLTAAKLYSQATNGKDFNMAQADRDYKFATNQNTQNTLNYLGSLVGSADPKTGKFSGGNLGDLRALSNEVGRTNFPALNNAAAWARYSTGDPKIAQFQATATEVADQVAKILQGGGTGSGTSDAKLQQAVNLFNTGFSKAQLAGVIDALEPLLSNRAKSMVNDNPYLSDYADQFGFGANGGAQAQQQTAPSATTIQKGSTAQYNGANYSFDGTQWVKQK